MTLYSYIIKHDGGFAPNPFFGCCTLACCKPGIRRKAGKGDWIIGLTPRAHGNKVVYFMEVEESIGFDGYWGGQRFEKKKPRLDAEEAAKQGDNIYKPSKTHSRGFRQLPSAHSKTRFGKSENEEAKERDLKGERVLVSTNFVYFGSKPKKLPPKLKCLIVGRGYRCHFSEEVRKDFLGFARKHKKKGVLAPPGDWIEDDAPRKTHTSCTEFCAVEDRRGRHSGVICAGSERGHRRQHQ